MMKHIRDWCRQRPWSQTPRSVSNSIRRSTMSCSTRASTSLSARTLSVRQPPTKSRGWVTVATISSPSLTPGCPDGWPGKGARMIKTIGGANRHPANRSLDDFRQYWAEHHGPFFAHTPHLMRYVQHITLPEAYGGNPAPTHDGVSMFWFTDLDAIVHPPESPTLVDAIPESHTDVYEWYVRSKRYGPPETMTLAETVPIDDRQLFDRAADWPTAHRRTSVVATEQVIKEGRTLPGMVKAVYMVARKPGLTIQEFQAHWREVHGSLVEKVPGLRRY